MTEEEAGHFKEVKETGTELSRTLTPPVLHRYDQLIRGLLIDNKLCVCMGLTGHRVARKHLRNRQDPHSYSKDILDQGDLFTSRFAQANSVSSQATEESHAQEGL